MNQSRGDSQLTPTHTKSCDVSVTCIHTYLYTPPIVTYALSQTWHGFWCKRGSRARNYRPHTHSQIHHYSLATKWARPLLCLSCTLVSKNIACHVNKVLCVVHLKAQVIHFTSTCALHGVLAVRRTAVLRTLRHHHRK